MLDNLALVDAAPAAPRNWVGRLVRFVATPVEHCELCGQLVPAEHDHMLDVERGQAVCACLGCATVLGSHGEGRYRAVPPRADPLPGFRMSDAEWRALEIPIGMAFLVRSGARGRIVAFYPGPGGATEAEIRPEAWATIAAANAEIADLKLDVEALLVNRIKDRRDAYRVSIDRCFVLVALFRQHWRGFTGGDAVWNAVDEFFANLNDPGAARRGWTHG